MHLREVAVVDLELLSGPKNQWSGGRDQQQSAGDHQAGLRTQNRCQFVDPVDFGLEPGQGHRHAHHRRLARVGGRVSGLFLNGLQLKTEEPLFWLLHYQIAIGMLSSSNELGCAAWPCSKVKKGFVLTFAAARGVSI